MRTLALLLLCACSAWAGEPSITFASDVNDATGFYREGPNTITLSSAGSNRLQIHTSSTNWTTLDSHGDFSVKCFDKDGSVWVAKWKKQKSLAALLDSTNFTKDNGSNIIWSITSNDPAPLPGGHTNFTTATPETAMKVMALRKAPMPPLPSSAMTNATDLAPLFYAQGQVVQVSAPGEEQPKHPRLDRPHVDKGAGHVKAEREHERSKAVQEQKAKAAATGILYPFAVEGLSHQFDTPDDWTGWLIQRRGPQEDVWSECGKSVAEPTRGCAVGGMEGYQYRLLRTAP